MDGGSQDRTQEVAHAHKVQTVVSPPVAGLRSVLARRNLVAKYCCSCTPTALCCPEHWTKLAMCSRQIQRSLVGIFDSFSTVIRPSADGLRDFAHCYGPWDSITATPESSCATRSTRLSAGFARYLCLRISTLCGGSSGSDVHAASEIHR